MTYSRRGRRADRRGGRILNAAALLVIAAAVGCGGADRVGGATTSAKAKSHVTTFDSVGAWPNAKPRRASAPVAEPSRKSAGAARPRVSDRLIAYGPKRRAEMAAYSRRHYGERRWRLTKPRVIVEHYTASSDFSSAYNTFARDVPDVELHELPGVCSHFIVDRDGTIYRLVPIEVRCRHTVGLNYTAIGIEHVGLSDGQVMNDKAQLRASLRLTRWLRCREAIRVRNVIGHNESLSSPYHHEDVAALRNQTHGDMRHATMVRYRSRLASAGC